MSPAVWTPAQLTNHQQLAAVEAFFVSMSQADVLRYCCNINRSDYPHAPPLAAHVVFVGTDTEGWDASSICLKELGINIFHARDMSNISSPGPWGENILNRVYFYFARLQKNAHLRNKNYSAGDPETNRFGTTRFLNDQEVFDCLTELFQWPVDSNNKDGCVRPVVLLGHALENDTGKMEKLLGFHPNAKGNLVRELDTQVIARDVGHWSHPVNQIGLQRLVHDMDFKYRDAHTASNDAAMTTIAAVQLILDQTLHRGTSQPKTLQDVIDRLEQQSQTHVWHYGSPVFCFRCGSRDHSINRGRSGGLCRVRVHCEHCAEERPRSQYGHRSDACVMKAYETSNSSRPKPRPAAISVASQSAAPHGTIYPIGRGILQFNMHGGNHAQRGAQVQGSVYAQNFPALPSPNGNAANHGTRPTSSRTFATGNIYDILNASSEDGSE